MIWPVRRIDICSAEEKAIRSSCNIASVECRCRRYEIISQNEGRGGINATVNVQVISPGYNGWNMSMDVKAYDANNMEVWSGTDMESVSAGFKMWCGPNVTRVVMRIRQPNNADEHFTVSVNWVDGVRS